MTNLSSVCPSTVSPNASKALEFVDTYSSFVRSSLVLSNDLLVSQRAVLAEHVFETLRSQLSAEVFGSFTNPFGVSFLDSSLFCVRVFCEGRLVGSHGGFSGGSPDVLFDLDAEVSSSGALVSDSFYFSGFTDELVVDGREKASVVLKDGPVDVSEFMRRASSWVAPADLLSQSVSHSSVDFVPQMFAPAGSFDSLKDFLDVFCFLSFSLLSFRECFERVFSPFGSLVLFPHPVSGTLLTDFDSVERFALSEGFDFEGLADGFAGLADGDVVRAGVGGRDDGWSSRVSEDLDLLVDIRTPWGSGAFDFDFVVSSI